MDGGEALAVLPAESCLLLLVDDLVESLVQEDGQSLPLVIGGWCVAGVVVGVLGDVIRDIGHTWMIGRAYRQIGHRVNSTMKFIGLHDYQFLQCTMYECWRKRSKEAAVIEEKPKNLNEITQSDLDRMEGEAFGQYFLHMYLIQDVERKIELSAPTPVVNQYCNVIHLIAECPKKLKVCTDKSDNSAPDYYAWSGETNKSRVLKDSKDQLTLSSNSTLANPIPSFVLAQNLEKGIHYDLRVVVYDREPYWWLPVALKVASASEYKNDFNIKYDGKLSITLYRSHEEEQKHEEIGTIDLSRNASMYKVDAPFLKENTEYRDVKQLADDLYWSINTHMPI